MRPSIERTLPLDEAAWRYAPTALRAKARSERASPPEPVIVPDLNYGSHRHKIEAFGGFLNALGRLTFQLTDQWAPSPEMKRRLIQNLSEGRLQAAGMKTQPEAGARPEIIPPFIFKGFPKVNWRTSTIENFGQAFAAVEVSRTAAVPARIPAPISSARGRPTKEPEINRAIDGLKRNCIDVGQMPRKSAIAAIIEYACEKLGANVQLGYSEPVLQRVLQRRFGKRA